MKLIVLSHKEIWDDPASPSGYATIGGFPFQMQSISELFECITVMAALRNTPIPSGAYSLTGQNLIVCPLPEPYGGGLRRKITLLAWLPHHLPCIWQAIQQADAVHTPVPGDIGTIGILVALAQRKPLFVRHCGTWGEPVTLAARFLLWLLERIAGGCNVVLATGGGDTPPSARNPNIRWIFSTTLTEAELESLPSAHPWKPGEPLRLVTTARLAAQKNIESIVRALPLLLNNANLESCSQDKSKESHVHLRSSVSSVSLDVLGDGEARPRLEGLVRELGLQDMVIFHGNVSHEDVMHALARSHIFVFPTRVKEGFPKAVLEALAVGLPVVATDVSVIPHLIKGCGVVLTDTGPQEVAKAVLKLAADPQQLDEMSTLARQRARQYTLERWRDEIGDHLRDAWGLLNSHV